MMLQNVFVVTILPLVAIHAVSALKRDWSHAPKIPAKSESSWFVRSIAAMAFSGWLAVHIAPPAYYLHECLETLHRF